jgi:hypothetical protein
LLAYGMHLPIATLVVVNWTVSTVVAMRDLAKQNYI